MRPGALAIARIASSQDAVRQDSTEGYWFGEGVGAGMVDARDLRMAAVSTRNPEWIDLTVFDDLGSDPRSTYQQLTVARACTIGLVEVDLWAPDSRAVVNILDVLERFLQITLYADDGTAGLPSTVLGRCVPVPLSSLSWENTQRYLLPLWVPVAVTAGQVIWVGFSPKAYLDASESGTTLDCTGVDNAVNARGNRDILVGPDDFLKADIVEPPLDGHYTSHADRRVWVRLYEAPETLTLAVPQTVAPPTSSAGVRAVIARPQSGRVSSAYAAGIRPGHGTAPWGSEIGGANRSASPGGATPAGIHHVTHENGGADEISVAGLSGALADDQKPEITPVYMDLVANQATYNAAVALATGRNLVDKNGLALREGGGYDYTVSGTSVTLQPGQVPRENEGWLRIVKW